MSSTEIYSSSVLWFLVCCPDYSLTVTAVSFCFLFVLQLPALLPQNNFLGKLMVPIFVQKYETEKRKPMKICETFMKIFWRKQLESSRNGRSRYIPVYGSRITAAVFLRILSLFLFRISYPWDFLSAKRHR